MEKKVEVKICVGTLCSVMGGSDLQLLEEHLPEALQGRVNITGSTCFDICKSQDKYGRPPYASVDGEIIPTATIAAIIEKIQQHL